ncbi:hypothetical protein BC936DRAFT_143952, partial [Jimgerdemannia flammicorona]
MPPIPKSTCPNPLYLACLAEHMHKAQATGSKAYYSYRKAHNAILHHPTTFSSPQDARHLNGIGPQIVSKLIKWLSDHNKRNSVLPATGSIPHSYTPRLRGSPYAILIALHATGVHIARKELEPLAQSYCDGAALSGLSTLVAKGLVNKVGNPAKYFLTDAGALLAQRLTRQPQAAERTNVGEEGEPSFPPITPTIFYPGTFDVVLILDSREIRSIANRDYICAQLQKHHVKVEVRALELGDI